MLPRYGDVGRILIPAWFGIGDGKVKKSLLACEKVVQLQNFLLNLQLIKSGLSNPGHLKSHFLTPPEL